jgi:DNA-directed RNA polymerase specialized sigma24 family protein
MASRADSRSKPYGNDVDRAILRGRADGLTYEQIGKALRLSKQAVHLRHAALRRQARGPRGAGLPELVTAVHETNRLLTALIVQVARTQTSDAYYPIEVLQRLGLKARQIAEAMGTTEATINVTKGRRRKRRDEPSSTNAVDPHDR